MAKILIVDDEPRIRDLIREHLQYAGFTCEEAGDGTAALSALSQGGIDLVILDIMMPFMDGMTCLREMRTRKIMTPVIMLTARSEEYDKLAVLEECRAELTAEGVKMGQNIEVGTMIETPAAVLIADELAAECDFFSIGTNDLTQYTCALDRQNAKLEPFFNPHHPAVLRAIKMTIEAGHRHGIWVGICGELGADTALTETFLRMGVDELSMNAKSILPVRKIIRSVDLSKPSEK